MISRRLLILACICSMNMLPSPESFSKTQVTIKVNLFSREFRICPGELEVQPPGVVVSELAEPWCCHVHGCDPCRSRSCCLGLHVASLPSTPATAPQQEADTEVNTETLNKSSQGTSSSTQATPAETASASKEKETSAEKSKDSSSVSIRAPLASDTNPLGQAESQDLSPCLPPLKVARCSRFVCLQGGTVRLLVGMSLSRWPFHWRARGQGPRKMESQLTSVCLHSCSPATGGLEQRCLVEPSVMMGVFCISSAQSVATSHAGPLEPLSCGQRGQSTSYHSLVTRGCALGREGCISSFPSVWSMSYDCLVNMTLGGTWTIFHISSHYEFISVCSRRNISHYPTSQNPLILLILFASLEVNVK